MKLTYHTFPTALQRTDHTEMWAYSMFEGRRVGVQVPGEVRITVAPGFVAIRADTSYGGRHVHGADLHLHEEVIVSSAFPEGKPISQAVRITERR